MSVWLENVWLGTVWLGSTSSAIPVTITYNKPRITIKRKRLPYESGKTVTETLKQFTQ